MSINCLLTNDVVLDKLVALVDAKSGNVSSVAGVPPIIVAPTAGDVVVSLPIAGTWTATNCVVKSTAPDALEWGTDAGGGGGLATASLPLLVTGSDVSLPIAGTWTATNCVVKSTAPDALEWGTDGVPNPVVTTTSYGIQANIFFNAGPTFDINSVTTSNTVLYSQQQICNLVATTALTPLDGAVIGFLLDVAFPITNVTTIVIPASVSVAGGTLVNAVLTVGNTVGPAPYQATFSIQTNNLTCALGDSVYFLFPPFTLALGM